MFHLILALALIGHVSALALNICASTNLGTAHTSYEFMSNGYCRDHCANAGYTAAITQNYDCWCSNSVPSNTVDSSLCDIGCPGYSQQEKCGGNGVYGYIVFGSVSTVSNSASSSGSSTSPSTATSVTSLSSSSSSSSSFISTSPVFSTVSPTTSSLSSSTTPFVISSAISSSLSSATNPSTSTGSTSSSSPSSTSSSSSSSSSSSISSSGTPSSGSSSSSSSSFSLTSTASSTSETLDQSLTSSPTADASSSAVRATTVISVVTINGTVTQQASTKYVTAVASTSSSPNQESTSASAVAPESRAKNSFFSSSAKVAGTFTAVGVVAVALVATLIYCCCFAAGGAHRDEYSDEENQYSSDEPSFAKTVPVAPGKKSRTSSYHSNLKRSGSSKSILAIFDGAGSPNVGRSLSRKKLNPKNEPAVEGAGPIMAPISEFDNVLDPRAMFEENNNSALSLNDENDYSRRIWHVTNPE